MRCYKQRVARRALCQLRDDVANIPLNGICVSCGDRRIQARRQAGLLRNSYRVLIDGAWCHNGTGVACAGNGFPLVHISLNRPPSHRPCGRGEFLLLEERQHRLRSNFPALKACTRSLMEFQFALKYRLNHRRQI